MLKNQTSAISSSSSALNRDYTRRDTTSSYAAGTSTAYSNTNRYGGAGTAAGSSYTGIGSSYNRSGYDYDRRYQSRVEYEPYNKPSKYTEIKERTLVGKEFKLRNTNKQFNCFLNVVL